MMPASKATTEESKKPKIVEMKERPGVEADYVTEQDKVKIVFTVEKEISAKDIDLDVAET